MGRANESSPIRLRPAIANLPSYVPGARQAPGSSALKLSSNENPYPPLPAVIAALTDASATVNRYPDMFASGLLDALAARFDRPPEDIVVGVGSVGVLSHLIQAVAGPGDEVIFPWRSFEAYPILVGISGATAVPVPLAAQGRLDIPAMIAAITPATRAVIVCAPNNPTGTVIHEAELQALIAAVPSDVVIAIDEAYVDFIRDPLAADGLSAGSTHDNVVVLRTFSKAYGLAGLRVGFALAHPAVASAIRTTSIPFGVSGAAQLAAIASLASEFELQERVEQIVGWRERLVGCLDEIGVQVPRSEANFIWLELGERTEAFALEALERGLIVRPFGAEGVRISVGEPASQDPIVELISRYLP